jgi:hypothetical protein
MIDPEMGAVHNVNNLAIDAARQNADGFFTHRT